MKTFLKVVHVCYLAHLTSSTLRKKKSPHPRKTIFSNKNCFLELLKSSKVATIARKTEE